MLRIQRRKRLFTAIIGTALLIMATGCIVPDNTYLMELNRTGKWQEAEKVGMKMLENRNTFTHSQTCETYFHIIYAQTRMERESDAVRLLNSYETFRDQKQLDPDLRWLDGEMANLKKELGLLNEIQLSLLSAMDENGKGNYTKARDICDKVLTMDAVNDIQRATAHFVAAVCSIRLEEYVKAELYFGHFESLKSALPPGHRILEEISYVREGLSELKNALQY
ncbi:MAG: hypothetical protein JEY99_14975 [Spirochaetales bacterium]|nr:hypothetical protein [Spirochaetales bacterium]